jgi:putative heme transporter
MPFVQEDTASRFVHQLADRIVDLARQPELVRRGVLWAAANWLLDAAALWVFLRAFGSRSTR